MTVRDDLRQRTAPERALGLPERGHEVETLAITRGVELTFDDVLADQPRLDGVVLCGVGNQVRGHAVFEQAVAGHVGPNLQGRNGGLGIVRQVVTAFEALALVFRGAVQPG